METHLTVFVCSTYSDLTEEREAVLDAIRRLQLQHDSMEFFGARADRPIETCLAEVRRSNVLVVVVGHRYGTIVQHLGISYSEAEYTEGYRLNRPCLVYMRDDNVPILPKYMERDPEKLKLLDSWKLALQDRHTVASFKASRDLAVQVAADLGRTITELAAAENSIKEAREQTHVKVIDEVSRLISDAVSHGIAEEMIVSTLRRAISSLVSGVEHLGASIFLSYATAAREIVRQVAEGLKTKGLRVWFDEGSIQVGTDWVREIERGLDSSDFILFFISQNSVRATWPQKELQIALRRQVSGEGGARILPILLEHADVPPLLRSIQWLDMTDSNVERAVARIVEAIHRYTSPVLWAGDNKRPARASIPENKIVEVLDEERGIVGAAARRLGVTPKRLYQLLQYYNIQAREFR